MTMRELPLALLIDPACSSVYVVAQHNSTRASQTSRVAPPSPNSDEAEWPLRAGRWSTR